MSENDITRLIIKVTRDTLPQVKDKGSIWIPRSF
jgi:hypothetical protein